MASVELVYVPQEGTPICSSVAWVSGMSVQDVLDASSLVTHHPETATLSVGIFSKMVGLSTLVRPGDRVEIYRSLTRDPKEARRVRAKKSVT